MQETSPRVAQLKKILEANGLAEWFNPLRDQLDLGSFARLMKTWFVGMESDRDALVKAFEADEALRDATLNPDFVSSYRHATGADEEAAERKTRELLVGVTRELFDATNSIGLEHQFLEYLIRYDLYHLKDGLVRKSIMSFGKFFGGFRQAENAEVFIKELGGGKLDTELVLTSEDFPSWDKDRKVVACSAGSQEEGFIEFAPWIFDSVVDTSPVQRLRGLKQLGLIHYVFPEATHNRFEHSLGVGYIAGEMVEELSRRTDVTRVEKEFVRNCAIVGGLCHDLGHGPFSHTFEKHFVRALPGYENWTHEEMSLKCFDKVVEEAIEKQSSIEEFYTANTVNFIKDVMTGVEPGPDCPDRAPLEDLQNLQRAVKDVVANKRHGLDVDRLDYLNRDGRVIGETCSDFCRRIIRMCAPFDGEVAFHVREQPLIYRSFYQRDSLFQRVYHHRKCQAVEMMMVHAMKHCDPIMKFSDRLDNVDDYLLLSDATVESSPYYLKKAKCRPDLTPEEREGADRALDLMKRIDARDFYRFCSEASVSDKDKIVELYKKKSGALESEIARHWPRSIPIPPGFTVEGLILVCWTKRDLGDYEKVKFYNPENRDAGAFLTPLAYHGLQQRPVLLVRLYVTCNDGLMITGAKEAFSSWARANGFEMTQNEGQERAGGSSPSPMSYVSPSSRSLGDSRLGRTPPKAPRFFP